MKVIVIVVIIGFLIAGIKFPTFGLAMAAFVPLGLISIAPTRPWQESEESTEMLSGGEDEFAES